ncbi:hypothetical protein BTO04_01770 [Polaribacter sp. SA4-10]|uniref:glycosyltransferase family 2 protein n=1 Tax=Polaribacter sp. SA4-10 TaxID=754397 RepID=UPI000B3C49CF|nr:glycosyltransferase family 2 protein [Polaribacter sp. SA4-10]ARV05498.1 hypothetical protein BTO04_01770 [Polaribacter sp. SA4-10]
MNSLVSIIIPTYNRGHLISETLDCVLKQTYKNWECIIIDDFSTDNTSKIVLEYCKIDSRFKLIKKKKGDKKGASSARNIGILKSKGSFIKFLDSDDIIDKNNVKAQYEDLNKEYSYACSICKWAVFSESIHNSDIKKNMTYYKDFTSGLRLLENLGESNSFIPLMCVMINRNLIDIAGMWNESLTLNDDGEFFTRIFLKSNKIKFTRNTLTYYRKTGNSLSSYNYNKLPSLLLSWKLIENHMNYMYKDQFNIYVRNAKRRIFLQIKKEYTWFVVKNFSFFKEAIIYRIVRKLKSNK